MSDYRSNGVDVVDILTAANMTGFHATSVETYVARCARYSYPMSRGFIEHDLLSIEKYVAEIRAKLDAANIVEA